MDYYYLRKPSIISIHEVGVYSSTNDFWRPCHWCEIINLLAGHNSVSYITDWIISDDSTVKNIVPKGYKGKILERGNKVPILLEVPQVILKTCSTTGCYMCGIWNYGTWGYIIPKPWEEKFISYTKQEDFSLTDIESFFDNVTYTFWIGGEIDILYLLSQQNILEQVSEILCQAKSDHFYL